MNYRHAFHAGNFADVMKHAALALLVRRMQEKPAAFAVLDTHAGIGLYDLESDEAKRTGEAEGGIRRVLATANPPAELEPYLKLIGDLDGRYPGSPMVVRRLLREDDRLIGIEKHPDDAVTLKALFRGDRQVSIHQGDGWQAIKAHLPTAQKRALILIDPPYEEMEDPARLIAAAQQAVARMPDAVLCLWHPIKERAFTWRLNQAVEDAKLPKALSARLMIRADDDPRRLNGSGLILINTPWQFEDRLRPLLDWLTPVLAVEPTAGWSVEAIG